MHYRFLNQFTEVWVPDVEESPGLAGELSHPTKLPKGCRYIGPISRVEPPTVREQQHLLLLISGPEPTRTQFEHMLQKQLDTYPGAWKLVRGVPGGDADAAHGIYAHLNAADLSMLLSRTSLVICRPGYTSVMDLLRLGQKALLVPTPGQTEQEYLAVHLERSGYFPYLSQEEFTLNAALEKAKQFPYAWPELDFEAYRKVLEEFVKYRC
jgi:UDP-N-acetylglucosamine transferase subunit ALG13